MRGAALLYRLFQLGLECAAELLDDGDRLLLQLGHVGLAGPHRVAGAGQGQRQRQDLSFHVALLGFDQIDADPRCRNHAY